MTELISYEELKNHLLSISDEEHKALLCTIYAGMARVGEIMVGRTSRTRPLYCKDVVSFDNRMVLFIRTGKTGKPRKVPIFRNREQWLCTIIEKWRDHIGQGALFPYSTRWAMRIFKKWFPDITSNRTGDVDGSKHTIHWLRGWRYSHYKRGDITGKPVDSKVATFIGGWVSSAVPEKYYDFTQIDDYLDELENTGGES